MLIYGRKELGNYFFGYKEKGVGAIHVVKYNPWTG